MINWLRRLPAYFAFNQHGASWKVGHYHRGKIKRCPKIAPLVGNRYPAGYCRGSDDFLSFYLDLSYFRLFAANLLQTPWQMFARGIATTFLFVLGISMILSYTRERQRTGQADLFLKYLRRGAELFGLGLVVTLGTYLVIGRGFVILASCTCWACRQSWLILLCG